MTTTASKSALRAKATAKRTKAAQRTPLPPKSKSDLELVREAVEENKRAKSKPKPLKAEFYAEEFRRVGWKPEIDVNGDLQQLTLRRGNETLYLEWRGNAHVSNTSTYTNGDHTIKIRNYSEAMRFAVRPPDEAKAKTASVANNKYRRKSKGPKRDPKGIPFDPETASDEEVLAALQGRNVTWHNRYRADSESGTIGSTIHVSRHARGHRIVSFVDPQYGYRAFRLDQLESVGGQVNIEQIKRRTQAQIEKARKTKKAA